MAKRIDRTIELAAAIDIATAALNEVRKQAYGLEIGALAGYCQKSVRVLTDYRPVFHNLPE